jgi:hypothetical protein
MVSFVVLRTSVVLWDLFVLDTSLITAQSERSFHVDTHFKQNYLPET